MTDLNCCVNKMVPKILINSAHVCNVDTSNDSQNRPNMVNENVALFTSISQPQQLTALYECILYTAQNASNKL